MLLVLDVGNTNISLGLFQGEGLLHHWRIASRRGGTPDEYGVLLRNLLEGVKVPLDAINAVMMASVVPPLDGTLEEMLRGLLKLTPLTVGPGTKTGMPVLSDNPREVGADRIVNAVATVAQYGGPAIVVDFGTATTFDAVSARGEYLGGVIAPGIGISAEALFERAAKLPRIEITRPRGVIGKNTVASMQSGLFYGYLALVDGVVRRMQQEMGGTKVVVATGGLAHLILADSETVDRVDPLLTLTGLRLLYERNR